MIKVIKKDEHIKQVLKDTHVYYKDIPHEEVLLVVLGKEKADFFSRIIHTSDTISMYFRKKERIYEKDVPFHQLSHTLIEFLMSQTETTLLHVSESFFFKDPFFQKDLNPSMTPSIIGVPLFDEDELIAIIVLYTTLMEIDSLLSQINQTNAIVAKLLKQSILLDQVLPNEISLIKERLMQVPNGVLMNHDKGLCFLSEDAKSILHCESELIKKEILDQKLVQIKTIELELIEQITYHQASLGLATLKQKSPHEALIIPKKNVMDFIKEAQNNKSKLSVFALYIKTNHNHFAFLSYQNQEMFYHDLEIYIEQFFNQQCQVGRWLDKGTIVIVDGLIDERIMKRFMDSTKHFVNHHQSNTDMTYTIHIGVVRFGKDAKLSNDYFTPIDVLFDCTSSRDCIYSDDLLKVKLRNQERKMTCLRQIKAINATLEIPIFQSITKEINYYKMSLQTNITYQEILLTKELSLWYSKKLIQLLDPKPSFKYVIELPIEVLSDDAFYNYFKETIIKKNTNFNQIMIEISYVNHCNGFQNNKLDRYHQLGVTFVLNNILKNGFYFCDLSKLNYQTVLLDASDIARYLKDPLQKTIIQTFIGLLIDQGIHIIICGMTDQTMNLLPKEPTVFYTKENA